MNKLTIIFAAIFIIINTVCGETIPQKPDRYFNDSVGLVAPAKGNQFNERLAQFERDTSNQFVVAIYPYMDTDSDAADYTQRIAQNWGVGQKDKNNGVILFIFMKTANGHGHIRIVPGYGLEGAIPDATAKEITSKMALYFKNKNFDKGLEVGVSSVIEASKNEHKGTGETVAEQKKNISPSALWIIAILGILGIIVSAAYSFIYFNNRKSERELNEKRERMERLRQAENLYVPLTPRRPLPRPMKPAPPRPKEKKESYIPVPIPIPIFKEDKDDDDDDKPSYSSSSSSDDSISSLDTGGGSFGGAGAGSDF